MRKFVYLFCFILILANIPLGNKMKTLESNHMEVVSANMEEIEATILDMDSNTGWVNDTSYTDYEVLFSVEGEELSLDVGSDFYSSHNIYDTVTLYRYDGVTDTNLTSLMRKTSDDLSGYTILYMFNGCTAAFVIVALFVTRKRKIKKSKETDNGSSKEEI